MKTSQKRQYAAIGRDGLAQIGPSYYQLRGIRFAEGEGGAAPAVPAEPAAPAATPPAPAPQPTPPAPTSPVTPPAPQAPAQPPVNFRGDPDEYVRELREEAKNHRLAAEKAANDFAAAQAERDANAKQLDALARQNKVLLVAPTLGANPAALLNAIDFTTAFAAIDLSDEEKVKAAITDAIEKNSTFKAGPVLPSMSGGGHQGGTPSSATPTLDGAVKAALGG